MVSSGLDVVRPLYLPLPPLGGSPRPAPGYRECTDVYPLFASCPACLVGVSLGDVPLSVELELVLALCWRR